MPLNFSQQKIQAAAASRWQGLPAKAALIGCSARLGYPSPPMWPTSIRASSGARWNPSSGMRLVVLNSRSRGGRWIANLYCNVFEMEHGRRRIGA